MNYISIPIITLFVYLIIEFLKSIIKTEFFKAFIPILSSLLGAGIAVLMFYVVPNFYEFISNKRILYRYSDEKRNPTKLARFLRIVLISFIKLVFIVSCLFFISI